MPESLNVAVPSDETLAPVAPIQLALPGEDGGISHVVGSGQSFWAIAARYEIPLEQLYLFNNLTEDSVINPGDTLIIRLADGQDPPPTPTPPASHIVRQGDSLWTIAAWYKLSLEELLWLNSMAEDSLVQEGDEVRIRLLPGEQPPPTATTQSSHIVRAGDTAWGISVRYGLALEQLLGFNSLTENSVLSVGDKLLIVAPSPTPTETPELTPTLLATATTVPVTVARITSTPLPQVLSLAKQSVATPIPVAPNNSTEPFGFGLEPTIIVIGALFLGIGTVAILVLKKQK
jgi:LysM repeat protein